MCADFPDWYNKPPLSPSERLRLYGTPAARPEAILTGPTYDVHAHYARVKALDDAYPFNNAEKCATFTQGVIKYLLQNLDHQPVSAVVLVLESAINRLLSLEGFYLPCFHHAIDRNPVPAWQVRIEREALLREEAFYTTYEPALFDTAERFADLLVNFLDQYAPEAAFNEVPHAHDTVPLIELAHMPDRILGVLFHACFIAETSDGTGQLFPHLRDRLWKNLYTASGYTAESIEQAKSPKLVLPLDSELPTAERANAYFRDTPLLDLLLMPLPFQVPQEVRFEHTHIIGGIGHGKTQLLQTLMLADFDAEEKPAVVAIDSQGDMIRTLSRLARFDPARDDRLIVLNPADYEWPLRLNIFDMSGQRLAHMKPGAREQVRFGIIELYDYIFAGLLDAETTQKQSVVFRYLAGLMLTIPDATIQTMRQLLEDPAPFQSYIERLTGTARSFFDNEFKDKSFFQTRKQILRRLYGILSNPVFERMFSAPRNGFDMKAALDGGKIVLINTAKDVLKAEASAMFGRYCIALIMQAVLERAAEEQERRRPAFVYIDEAAEYFDQNIDTLLIQARKYKVGLTFAHQHLHQLKPEFRASVMTTAAVRFAGGVSDEDARALKSDMRTSADFLLSMRKRNRIDTQFACFVRNYTANALTFTIPFGRVEKQPWMTREALAKFLARNRAAVAAPIAEAQAHIDAVTKPAKGGEDPEEFADRY
jgi:hypothetical protein